MWVKWCLIYPLPQTVNVLIDKSQEIGKLSVQKLSHKVLQYKIDIFCKCSWDDKEGRSRGDHGLGVNIMVSEKSVSNLLKVVQGACSPNPEPSGKTAASWTHHED